MAFAPQAIMLGIAAYSAIQAKQQSNLQIAQLGVQEKTEEVEAGRQAIERRRDLLRVMAARNAAAGAAGIETSGSVAAIVKADIRDAADDLMYGEFNSAQRRQAHKLQSRAFRRAGNAKAVTSLLDGVAGAYGGGI